MISKEQFIELLEQHKTQSECIDNLEDNGLYIIDSPIIEFGFLMFDKVLEFSFSKEGLDWIYWYLFEKRAPWNKKVLEAYNEDNSVLPTETIEDMWNIVEKYRI